MKVSVQAAPVDAARLAPAVGEVVMIEVKALVSRVVVETVDGTDGTILGASVEFDLSAVDLPAEVLARLPKEP